MSPSSGARLALDEMFSPSLAEALRDLGHDAVAVAEQPSLRAMTDEQVLGWVAAEGRWLLTENVKDFRPIMLRTLHAGIPVPGILFTSSRTFPRSRKNPGPLISALHQWLEIGPPAPPITEDWLLAAANH